MSCLVWSVIGGILVIGICLILYMWIVAFENNVKMEQVVVKGQVSDQFSIFFISDVHNRRISKKMMQKVSSVDAVIIGGDFCDRRTSLEKLRSNLQLLKKNGPVYFMWGNNDREIGEEALRAVFQEEGIHLIENDAMQLENRTNTTWIAAIDDYGTKNSNFQQALSKCREEDVVLCVSHNPLVFHLALNYGKPSLFMGGHLHGGQIRLGPFGLHPNGSFTVQNGIPALISNGYGTTLVPFRLGAHPEVHVLSIQVEASNGSTDAMA